MAAKTKKADTVVTSATFGGFVEKMNIRIIFTSEILGSCPANADIYSKYVADKATDADVTDEISALGAEQVLENGTTKFLTVDGKPALSNHTWLGFMKEKIGFLKLDNKKTASGALTNYKKRLDNGIAFANKFSILVLPKGESTGMLQRPLRANTQQGERIALASSITCPPRTRTRFTILMSNSEYRYPIEEALNMGRFSGTGQWRGSGKKGTFLWEEFSDDGEIIGGNTKTILGVTTKDANFNDVLCDYINHEEIGEIEEDFE